jgi:GTPase SAR1 family protein
MIITVLLGVEKSGKSMLTYAVKSEKFYETYSSTIGVDFSIVKLNESGSEDSKLQIWDTAGSERFRTITESYICNKNSYCFVIDPTQDIQAQITYFSSFLGSKSSIAIGCFCNLIISKLDLLPTVGAELFTVRMAQIEEFKTKLINDYQMKCELVETSAKDKTGIEELKTLLVKQFLENEKSIKAASTKASTTASSTQQQSGQSASVMDYRQMFSGLCAIPDMRVLPQDKAAAIDIFTRELNLADTLEKIQDLLTVAEHYINRHRNPKRDRLFLNPNTKTWQNCIKAARVEGLSILESKVQANDQTVTEDTLVHWHKQSLFAKHRNNSIFKGAFGHTKAQHQIDDLVWELRLR